MKKAGHKKPNTCDSTEMKDVVKFIETGSSDGCQGQAEVETELLFMDTEFQFCR